MSCLVAEYSTRPCSREASHQDPISPGKIHDDETLCRAGYSMHNRDGNPKIGLIRSSDLAKGELSIWREAPATARLAEIVDTLREAGPEGQTLDWVFAVKAKELRNLVPGSPLCAIDDTDCGGGRRHKAHGVLAGCEHLGFRALATPDENPTFSAIRRALHEIFSRNIRWKRETVAPG